MSDTSDSSGTSSGERRLNVDSTLQNFSVEDLKKMYINKATPEKVICLNLVHGQNIGTIVRTASLFGFSEVILLGRGSYDKRTAVGMNHYIPVTIHRATKGHHNDEYDMEKIKDFLRELSKTHTIIVLENNCSRYVFPLYDMSNLLKARGKPPAFLLGNEGNGVPDEIVHLECVVPFVIPQNGVGRSFNVASAFAIAGWEWERSKLVGNEN